MFRAVHHFSARAEVWKMSAAVISAFSGAPATHAEASSADVPHDVK
jgi:hypothetical protein